MRVLAFGSAGSPAMDVALRAADRAVERVIAAQDG
jgi:hypothetical protein